jgi:hypothetical protein
MRRDESNYLLHGLEDSFARVDMVQLILFVVLWT